MHTVNPPRASIEPLTSHRRPRATSSQGKSTPKPPKLGGGLGNGFSSSFMVRRALLPKPKARVTPGD